jgi:hypothetical protein
MVDCPDELINGFTTHEFNFFDSFCNSVAEVAAIISSFNPSSLAAEIANCFSVHGKFAAFADGTTVIPCFRNRKTFRSDSFNFWNYKIRFVLGYNSV